MYLETGLSVCVSDFDFTSIYPNNMWALNTSRMTLTFVPYAIEGRSQDSVRNYFINLINVRENAEILCSEYMGLPNFENMAILMEEKLREI